MICEVCGKECERRSGIQKYCSECAKKVYAQQNRQWRKDHPEEHRAHARAYAKKYYKTHREEINLKRKKPPKYINCKVCGKECLRRGGNQKRCPECSKKILQQYYRKWQQANRAKMRAYAKKHYAAHREEICLKQKRPPKLMICEVCGSECVRRSGTQKRCPECAKKLKQQKTRKWKQEHREQIQAQQREHYAAHREEILFRNKVNRIKRWMKI